MLSSAITQEVKTFIVKIPAPANNSITTYVSRYSCTGTFPSLIRLALVKIWNAIKSIFIDTDEKAAKKSLSDSLRSLRGQAVNLEDSKIDEIVNLTLPHLIRLNSLGEDASRSFLKSLVDVIEKCNLYNSDFPCSDEIKKDQYQAVSDEEMNENELCHAEVTANHSHHLTIIISENKETIEYARTRSAILNLPEGYINA